MKTQLIADSRSQAQSPQIWDKPTPAVQIGDYVRVPFAPVMQVVERDVLENGQVWLLLKPTTGSYSEEWVLEPEAEQPPAPQPKPQKQPSGFSGDSVASQMRSPIGQCQRLEPEVAPQQPALQPTAEAESEQGRMHGQHDAAARLHPIYTKPVDAYASGYLAGYSNHRPSQQPQGRQPVEWSVTWNQRWGWYEVWVGHRWIGRAATEQEAERMATKRIATDEIIHRQNAAVMASYAD